MGAGGRALALDCAGLEKESGASAPLSLCLPDRAERVISVLVFHRLYRPLCDAGMHPIGRRNLFASDSTLVRVQQL